MNIKHLLQRYMAEADDAGGDLSGAVDRGDGGAQDASGEDRARDESGKFVAEEKADADEEKLEGEDKGDDKPEKKETTNRIPVKRFNEAVAKERSRTEAAERRAAELEKQIKQVGHSENLQQLEQDIEAIEDKLESARLDGNKDKARELSKELRMKERQISVAESTRMSSAAKDQAREEIRLDMTIDKLEGQYPVLNERDEAFDQDIVDLVLATQRDLINRERMAPAKALEEATKKVMHKVMPANSDGVKPEAEEADTGGLKGAKGTEGRKEAQVKKNIDTANKQPASMKESGMDSDKAGQAKKLANAQDMSYEEFSALPEATKAKMRGDFA